MASNPVFDAVRTVLAVREYQDRAVPDEVIGRMVEAARLTASSQNRQPWHFVVVQDRQRLKELARLVPTGPYIATAAGAVVVAFERESPFGLSDASRAIQDLVLTAWSEGVGTNWAGFGNTAERHDAVRRALELPAQYQVLAVIPFGYPARAVGKGLKKRKPLGEVASRERYGEAFPESAT